MGRRDARTKPDRRELLKALVAACHRLLLDPRSEETRALTIIILGAADLERHDGDTSLATALLSEARAHADELAFRLESPGYSSLYIRAVTARLCQTLQALKLELSPAPGTSLTEPAPLVRHAGS